MKNIKEKINECLNCKTKPCTTGCPLENNIPEFINLMKQEKYEEAYYEISKTTVLSSICGRICPHQSQCMGKCIRGIKGNAVSIGDLEAYIGDMAIKNNWKLPMFSEKLNKKVAIVGSGPAGLTCAAFLARSGFNVTIYEKYSKLGGILRHGIPDFRLDKNILDGVINKILDLGVQVEYEKELGKNLDLKQLANNYDAVFLGIGANIPWKMGIPGEKLEGVYGGNSLLEKNKFPDLKEKKVAIIGGGNVAMDCARTVKKLGAQEVKIIYRRAKEQMPAEEKEIEDAENEGIEFLYQNNIVKIIGNNKVEKIECIKTELIQKPGDIRLSPVDIEGSNYLINMDYVIMAIGAQPEEEVLNKLGIELNSKGHIKVDENYKTSINNVFAGGDIIGNKSTVAWAARAGKNAAISIDKMLNNY